MGPPIDLVDPQPSSAAKTCITSVSGWLSRGPATFGKRVSPTCSERAEGGHRIGDPMVKQCVRSVGHAQPSFPSVAHCSTRDETSTRLVTITPKLLETATSLAGTALDIQNMLRCSICGSRSSSCRRPPAGAELVKTEEDWAEFGPDAVGIGPSLSEAVPMLIHVDTGFAPNSDEVGRTSETTPGQISSNLVETLFRPRWESVQIWPVPGQTWHEIDRASPTFLQIWPDFGRL